MGKARKRPLKKPKKCYVGCRKKGPKVDDKSFTEGDDNQSFESFSDDSGSLYNPSSSSEDYDSSDNEGSRKKAKTKYFFRKQAKTNRFYQKEAKSHSPEDVVIIEEISKISNTSVRKTRAMSEGVDVLADGDVKETPKKQEIVGSFLSELKNHHGNQLYIKKRYCDALEAYTAAIDLCSYVPKYYSNRAACHIMMFQFKKGLSDAKACIKLDPLFVKAYPRMLKCSIMLGDIAEAEAAVKMCSDKDILQNELNELAQLKKFLAEGTAAWNKKEYKKVIWCMDRCLQISPFSQRFKLMKIENLIHAGRFQEAEVLTNAILQENKKNIDAMFLKGMSFYLQENFDAAISNLRQVLILSTEHLQAKNIYNKAKNLKSKKDDGNKAFKSGNYKEAYNLYTEALLIDKENTIVNSRLHFNRAMASNKLRCLHESISECTNALQLNKNYLKALLLRASCYMELKNYEQAIADYERAYKLENSKENEKFLQDAKGALKASKIKNCYKILEIQKNASVIDIKKAYKKKALQHHPDKHSNALAEIKQEHESKFKLVGEAYNILSDPFKRSLHDAELFSS